MDIAVDPDLEQVMAQAEMNEIIRRALSNDPMEVGALSWPGLEACKDSGQQRHWRADARAENATVRIDGGAIRFYFGWPRERWFD